MVTKQLTTNDLLAQIAGMRTPADSDAVAEARRLFYEQATAAERDRVTAAIRDRTRALLTLIAEENQQTGEMLWQNGIDYDLGEWLSIANYARKYGVSTHVVHNWLRRGVIPADCSIELAVFNNIRMVKDRPYRAA